MFSIRIPVRFGDTDPAGLVYYPNLFHYCHVAMEEFFGSQCGTPYHQMVAEDRIGFPVVKAVTEFHSPLVYGDEVEVKVGLTKVGRSSISLVYQLTRNGDLCVSSTQVHVAMDLDTKRAISIPSPLRQHLERILA
jgi:4-hydroxybenzoyl-CoA thioesterase